VWVWYDDDDNDDDDENVPASRPPHSRVARAIASSQCYSLSLFCKRSCTGETNCRPHNSSHSLCRRQSTKLSGFSRAYSLLPSLVPFSLFQTAGRCAIDLARITAVRGLVTLATMGVFNRASRIAFQNSILSTPSIISSLLVTEC